VENAAVKSANCVWLPSVHTWLVRPSTTVEIWTGLDGRRSYTRLRPVTTRASFGSLRSKGEDRAHASGHSPQNRATAEHVQDFCMRFRTQLGLAPQNHPVPSITRQLPRN